MSKSHGEGLLDLSICLVSWNTTDDLARSLDSIFGAGGPRQSEVIVVDNASRDGSPEMVAQRFPQVRLIANRENLGFAQANNQGIRASAGRYVLLLNPDTIVHGSALSEIVDFMDAHRDAGAVGPKLLNPDGSLQFSCRRFPRLATGLFRNLPLGRLLRSNRFTQDYLMSDWHHSQVRQVDWVSGAAICLRREALEQVGLLDEKFFMYCEDVDWCYRAGQKGWRIYYLPTAVITHARGRSSDQVARPMVVAFHRSMMRFYRKHYAEGYPVLLRWLPALGIWLRAAWVLAQNQLTSWWGVISRLKA